MSFSSDLRHTPATTKPPGTITSTTFSNGPLVNLSTIQSRMDSLQKFLSDSVNSNTLLSQHQMDLISNEITSAIHQIIVNGASLVSCTIQSPFPPPPPAKSNHKRTYSELEYEDSGGVGDWEIIELDAVELLAEHIHFCDFCGKGFKRDANLRMHMRAHGNQYKTLEALAKPEKMIESGSVSGTGSKKLRFSCPFVGCTRNKMHNKFRPLKSAVCVKNHFKRSHCPKMYTCTRCNNKCFSVLADLKSHLKHCGETKWKCSCGTHFSRKDKLFGHMALFEGHMPAVDQVEEDLMMTKDVEMGPDNGSLDISGGSDNGFLDRLMLDGFESIDNYCFQDLLESSSPNGCQVLDRLESNSRTVKGAKIIGEDNDALSAILVPLRNFCDGSKIPGRDHDFVILNQSLRILSNLVAAGAINSSGTLDQIMCVLLGFTLAVLKVRPSNGTELVMKSFSITKKLLDSCGGAIGGSFLGHWRTLVELYSLVLNSLDDASGRILSESTGCIAAMLFRVAQALKVSSSPPALIGILKELLDHASSCGIADLLYSCLATSGTNLISGSSNLLRAAAEACRAVWLLVDSFELLSLRENEYHFPISCLRNPSLHRLDIRDHERGPLLGRDARKIIDAMTKAILRSKAVQVAVFYCLHQRHEASICAGVQLVLRCCLHSGVVANILCGLPSSLPVTTVVSGGGDGTIVSEVFSVLSSTKKARGEANTLVLNLSLLLATIAQCLKSSGRNSALFILTTSSRKQLARLSDLAHHFSADVQSLCQPHSASAMLALASILSLETGGTVETAILDIAVPMIPRTARLCEYLRNPANDQDGMCMFTGMLSHWHGLRDGSIGLLDIRLKKEGPLAVQHSCASGIPQLLIDLLMNNISEVSSDEPKFSKDQIGLSPIGVAWSISLLCQCLSGGVSTFRHILLKTEHVKVISDLILDLHLKLVKSWSGPGGGVDGARDTINAVIDLLAFPFVAVQNGQGLPSATASVNSGFLLNVGSPGGRVCPEDKDMVKAIESHLGKYTQILLEVGVPGIILRCLEHMESKDIARPVAFLAKMTAHRPLAVQLLGKGLMDPRRMKSLLDGSCPREVVLDVLMIVSDLARMDQAFYEYIDGADILGFLKDSLTDKDPNVRAKTCSAIGNMCRHSSYFYTSLARHGIISLLIDRCADSDKRTRKFACFAIGNAAYHNELLYDELRRSIPQLSYLLLSAEEDKTKANAAGALSNLVRNSNKLCGDIVSKGAMQALLKLVTDCSVLALSPNRRDTINESPLKIALFSLAKMCAHPPCRQFLESSELFPVVRQLQQSPESTIANYATVIVRKVAEN